MQLQGEIVATSCSHNLGFMKVAWAITPRPLRVLRLRYDIYDIFTLLFSYLLLHKQ
jgi:hypothetical protein